MTAPLARAALWLMAMQAVLAGLYWALLSTPESNAWMLTLSAALIATLVAVAGLALDVALRLTSGDPAVPRRAADWIRPGLRLVPALALALLVAGIAQWLGGGVEASRGRITAWLIARTGWADPEVLFTSVRWLAAFATWVVGPALALALFAALTRGVAASPRGWLGPATAWPTLLAGAVGVAALAWGWPWLAAWRPALPPTWVQLVAVAAKVAVGFAAVAVLVATMLRLTAPALPTRTSQD
jgi:hypothetical protein